MDDASKHVTKIYISPTESTPIRPELHHESHFSTDTSTFASTNNKVDTTPSPKEQMVLSKLLANEVLEKCVISAPSKDNNDGDGSKQISENVEKEYIIVPRKKTRKVVPTAPTAPTTNNDATFDRRSPTKAPLTQSTNGNESNGNEFGTYQKSKPITYTAYNGYTTHKFIFDEKSGDSNELSI
ncbi:unnamed protein product [Didymodactylos carnosus]|uniref:Uncharacterized protein n=1 Tax=Didymodactylos carnosus TaxID=1234261 RepID=A0A813YPY0_9BILA|nr:unnamed protein product [Didymodactylos carnosus]CAF1009323.1 unnamed protein product [Didymodactylos carnosus]CAF3672321.1 unnamed protein product [Didymodactylos carnosus]CAF3778117.1 unnamed protein product [Didymodactylos carnosus]